MRHVHIASIVLGFVSYAFIALAIHQDADTWGYTQPIGCVGITALITLAMQHAWRELTRPEVQRTFRLRR